TLGEKTFKASCFACHGMQGGGDGPAAKALAPAPVDFQGMQPSVRWAFHIITKGRPGTAMSGFASMPAKKRWALAYYVDSLFKPGAAARSARSGGDQGSDSQASAVGRPRPPSGRLITLSEQRSKNP
ncbi:MAG TPA: cytochrome c, partial [Gammaproteobacteria bacterium]|nr:cytochrome c [Gammaproteobacteria bacterium]